MSRSNNRQKSATCKNINMLEIQRNKDTSGLKKLARGVILGLSLVPVGLCLADDGNGETPGKADYITYCASCHGSDGAGNGPVAGSLKNRPPDLTFLHQQETDGAFPFQKVLNIIQGNPDHDKSIRTHGPADMPVWGKIIHDDSDHKTAVTNARLRNLTHYIKSLQK